jgi:hypothetical protein
MTQVRKILPDNHEILDRIQGLITAVYRERTVYPWDSVRERSMRYEALFRERLREWPLLNQTDPVYGGATALAFLLHPGHYIGVTTRDGVELRIKRLGGQCYQALIEISHIGPFARIRFTRETLDENTGRIIYEEFERPVRVEDSMFLDSVLDILGEENIEVLPEDVLQHPVPDVKLDVTELGCATVYHCLFDEE